MTVPTTTEGTNLANLAGRGYLGALARLLKGIVDQGVLDLTATADELNRVADTSARIVTTTASLALTEADHDGKTIVVDKADGAAITLPNATGSGARFKVIIGTAITSNSTTIKTSRGADHMFGGCVGSDDDGEGATGYTWKLDASDDTITLNGAATGGEAGDFFVLEDFATNKWHVFGYVKQSGGSEATPFSQTVS